MKFISIALVLTLFSFFCFAQESDDAWVRKSAFDGRVYSYEVVAYGATGDFKTEAKTKCHFGYFDKTKVLKSLDVKVVITGDFSSTSTYASRSGKLDIAAAIAACLDADHEVNRELDAPVEINFPKVSVSTKFTTNSL